MPCESPSQLIPLVVICYCGTIGNVATMMIMAPVAGKKSTAFILCALAVFDTGAIVTNTLDCFLQVQIQVQILLKVISGAKSFLQMEIHVLVISGIRCHIGG